ncbi:MAG: hypothetical protein ACHQIM_05405 [Sphingobacteriales bacterium]
MKKIQLSIVAMLLLGAVACKKTLNSAANINANVSSADAADMVAGSLSSNSNGIVNFSDDATLDAISFIRLHVACGTVKADTISRHSAAGAATTYSYNLTYNYMVNCSNNVPDSLSSKLVYSGSFSGPNLSSTNSGSSIFTVNGLLPTATNFVINGEYKQNGSFQSKVDTAKHGNNNIDIVVKGLTITKPARTVAGGTATISISGDTPKKGSFSYTGTLVFNGNGTATLTLNAKVYTINLSTGERHDG